MKKNILTALFPIVLTICFSSFANAQQKPSERSLAMEIQKIKAKQAARNIMLQQSTSHTTVERPASLPRATVNPVIQPARRQVASP